MFFPLTLTVTGQGAGVLTSVMALPRGGRAAGRVLERVPGVTGLGLGLSCRNVQNGRLFHAPNPPWRIFQTLSGKLKRFLQPWMTDDYCPGSVGAFPLVIGSPA